MLSFIKIVFFFIAGVFLVSYLNQNGPLIDFSDTTTGNGELSDRASYSRSYDDNNDGTVSDAEYRRGELRRIEDEVALIEDKVTEAVEAQNRSPYYEIVTLSSGNATAERHNEEYVTLSVSSRATGLINITGWRVESLLTGRGENIGKGIALLEESHSPWRAEKDILLAPGDSAVITSGGAAGIRTSFLTNTCMGYFDYDRFVPGISSSCPLLENEDLDRFGLSFDDFRHERDYDACMDAIESIDSCEIVRSPDRDLDDDCRDFIRDYSNYEGCVELHQNDTDFYGTEWRIFLNISRNDVWRREREAIALFDREGKIVDVVRY